MAGILNRLVTTKRAAVTALAIILVGAACSAAEPSYRIDQWERGLVVSPTEDPTKKVFLWFYEWHLFDAVSPGLHTPGPRDWSKAVRQLSPDQARGSIAIGSTLLTMESADYGVDIELSIRNESGYDWPELAAIIPCFNPGPNPETNPNYSYIWTPAFVDSESKLTWFVGSDGLELLPDRSIHFNKDFRPAVDELRQKHTTFPFDHKWPTAARDASRSVMIRESIDGQWVTGIAWDRSLSSQGHNPWNCMHLSVRVGPLKSGETRKIPGKVYLFQGTKEDCYQEYLDDFAPGF